MFALGMPLMALSEQEAVNGYYDSKSDWFVLEWTNAETGRQQAIYDSTNKVKPVIHASVELNSSTGSYTYSYQVTNQAGALQMIDDILVKHTAPVSEATSPPPQSEWHSSEYEGKSSWGWAKTKGAVHGIPAGQTASGFSFKSKGVPAIVDVGFTGKRRVEFSGPSDDDDSLEVQTSFEKVFQNLKTQYSDKFVNVVKKKTIGPINPPATINAANAIQNLIALVNQSRSQGWIDNDGIANNLLAKLNTAFSKVTSDPKTVKNVLNAFLNDVQAQNGKHISSEAYALLYFNGQYAISHM
jgi:hypothetical protein